MTEVASREREIAARIGKLFVQRRDVKAVQNHLTGSWARVNAPIKMSDVISHIKGETSIGHYLVDRDGLVRLFAFDIDLFKTHPVKRPHGYWPLDPSSETDPQLQKFVPRDAWVDRSHPSRAWIKSQMKAISGKIAADLLSNWDMPCAVSYSGSKGVHVYAFFDEPTPASEAREGANILLRELGWHPRSKNFWICDDQDPVTGFPNFEVEIYPKQDEVGEGGYGNLMRLPLGRNFKSERDEAFFIDFASTPQGVMKPADALESLTVLNPFQVGVGGTSQ